MRQRGRWVIVILALATAGGVRADELVRDPEYQIRVQNWTNRAFDRVVISFPEQTVDYGRVPARGFSAYRKVHGAVYKYAGANVRAGRQKLDRGVTDYVGEQRLPPGRHTYRFMIVVDEDGKERLYLEMGWFPRAPPTDIPRPLP